MSLPYGLVVRIRRSHRRGPGSIPGVGSFLFFPSSLAQKGIIIKERFYAEADTKIGFRIPAQCYVHFLEAKQRLFQEIVLNCIRSRRQLRTPGHPMMFFCEMVQLHVIDNSQQ